MFDLIFKVVEVVVRNQDAIIGLINKVVKTVSEVGTEVKSTIETIIENEEAYTAKSSAESTKEQQQGSSFAVWFQRVLSVVKCVQFMAPAIKSACKEFVPV